MTRKIKFIFVLGIVLCMLLTTTVVATNTIQPMLGEEIDTGEGYQNIVPLGGLEIDDENIEPINEEIDEEENEERDMLLYIALGVAGLIIISLIVVMVKKKS